jgi:hypothetical protein
MHTGNLVVPPPLAPWRDKPGGVWQDFLHGNDTTNKARLETAMKRNLLLLSGGGTVGTAGQGYAILLDGKPMRLPSGAALEVAHRRRADAIAGKWSLAGGTKGGEMTFNDPPLTRLAGTALERVDPGRATTIGGIARYGETDLLCYRAAPPESLVRWMNRSRPSSGGRITRRRTGGRACYRMSRWRLGISA